MKQIVIKGAFFLLSLILGLVILIVAFSPSLPTRADDIIQDILNSKSPELVVGDTGKVKSGDYEIWYESIKPLGEVKGTVLLIMGLGGDALEWPAFFYEPLVDHGYHVIRYDNRSTGNSEKVRDWSADHPYTLEDMSLDALSVLDEVGAENAHIIGISMGGMIGQSMAIHTPHRVQTLTSIMSSADINDPELPQVNRKLFLRLIAASLRYGIGGSEVGVMRQRIAARSVFVPYLSEDRMAVLAEKALYSKRNRDTPYRGAFRQHIAAINASGSRVSALKGVKVPSLVIHGEDDPLIPIEHGKKTANLIPAALGVWVPQMGHDFAPEHMGVIHEAIFNLLDG
ncbi:alpha/beta hydrolase [Cytophagaceae bacterium ABcell3]|nr:alpha/beta hydrolase [Cytophagaceae bacterium ABcell3]